jgi:hypothetical protein
LDAIINWVVELNKSNHAAFGILTVATMAGIGGVIAVLAELVFGALGIRSDKIEIQH